MENAVEDFFRGSRRINVIQFAWTSTIALGEGRIKADVVRPYVHPKPRFPLADLKFLEIKPVGRPPKPTEITENARE